MLTFELNTIPKVLGIINNDIFLWFKERGIETEYLAQEAEKVKGKWYSIRKGGETFKSIFEEPEVINMLHNINGLKYVENLWTEITKSETPQTIKKIEDLSIALYKIGRGIEYSKFYPHMSKAKSGYSLGRTPESEKAFKYGELYHEKCTDLMKIEPAPQAQKEAKEFVKKAYKKEFGKNLSNRQIQRYENTYFEMKNQSAT